MSLLQYTSKEMFSSTELIRKSKMIFDKLQKEEIEKAIILRDGKPSFMLLDFNTYEELINDYLHLKENSLKQKNDIKTIPVKEDILNENPSKEKIQNESIIIDEVEKKEINEDYQFALKQIESLDINTKSDKDDEQKRSLKKSLKEFWD
jgi:hypothetical protein